MTRLYVIDCNGISHWLWHSKGARMDAAGNELSLADATRNWFTQFAVAMGPSHAVAIFDGANNWRWQVHAEYKASRKAAPRDEEKIAALKTAPKAWADLGLPVLCYDTFEADDAIASIAQTMASDTCEVVIVSSDKDLMQLVGPNVRQYDPRPNKAGECMFYDPRAVEQKLFVPPHRVRELLAIWGDTSDDVPGVEGWGHVTAANAIKQTGSSLELFRKAAMGELTSITPKNQAKLVAQRAEYEMSFKLVGLRFDVPVPTELEAYRIAKQPTEERDVA